MRRDRTGLDALRAPHLFWNTAGLRSLRQFPVYLAFLKATMSLRAGTRLGHYDVTALIGEGGMGQVWQATDTQLNRQVALKILPDAFAYDPDRLARFTREAQILASLNHPNIAAIHGIEEAEGMRALVLELVEGPTLADRIAKGPIPLDEALPIAKESPDIKVGRSQRTGTTCAVSPAHLSSSNNHRLNTLRRLLAAAEQAPQPERGLRRRPSTEARKYCSGRSQKNP